MARRSTYLIILIAVLFLAAAAMITGAIAFPDVSNENIPADLAPPFPPTPAEEPIEPVDNSMPAKPTPTPTTRTRTSLPSNVSSQYDTPPTPAPATLTQTPTMLSTPAITSEPISTAITTPAPPPIVTPTPNPTVVYPPFEPLGNRPNPDINAIRDRQPIRGTIDGWPETLEYIWIDRYAGNTVHHITADTDFKKASVEAAYIIPSYYTEYGSDEEERFFMREVRAKVQSMQDWYFGTWDFKDYDGKFNPDCRRLHAGLWTYADGRTVPYHEWQQYEIRFVRLKFTSENGRFSETAFLVGGHDVTWGF